MALINLFNKQQYQKCANIYGVSKTNNFKKISSLLGLNVFKNKKNDNFTLKYIIKTAYINTIDNTINFKINKTINYSKVLSKHSAIDYNLKLNLYNNIKTLININSYKGFCHKNNLPVNGQRTKSNRYTQRHLSVSRLLKPKKTL